MDIRLPKILVTIAKQLSARGAKALVVGGAVRDALLKKSSKDFDIEVYNIESIESLKSQLSAFGSVNSVGKSFGILKLKVDNLEFDFSLPRSEKKVGSGHRGFAVTLLKNPNFAEAARRRDFTINAIGYDILEQKIIDPYNGRADLESKVLRIVDSTTFIEDPLRVYRAVGFVARFTLTMEPQTKALCKKMVADGALDELATERIWEEWKKLLLKSPKPSLGFEAMRELGIIKRYFSELDALIGVAQDPKYHPEGDVWVHTMMSLDAMAKLLEGQEIDQKQKLKLLLATLCHDLGKAVTSKVVDGRIRSIGHERAGVALTKSLLEKLTNEKRLIESIVPLVEHHLKPSQLYFGGAKDAAIKRLAKKVNIEELVLVARADFLGRTTKEAQSGKYKAGDWLLERARALEVSQESIKNIISGADLIALGLSPSKQFKRILEEVYELYIEEQISTKEEALEYVQEHYC